MSLHAPWPSGVPVLCAVLASACGPAPGAEIDAASRRAEIVTTDVRNFIAIAASLDTTDAECGNVDGYFAAATPGLADYSSRFSVGPRRLCQAIRASPQRYVGLEAKLATIDSLEPRLQALLERLSELVPDAEWPPVYFVVGNGVSAGSGVRGRAPKVLIGLERVGSLDGLPRLVAHEAIHTQQRHPGIRVLTGGSSFIRFMRGTVLRHSIVEGAADFLAELIVPAEGGPPSRRNAYGDANEAELWLEFQRDMHGRDYGMWLYNGWSREALGDRPADLGYYFGYRITQAYYDRADDKQAAVREILTVGDFPRFLHESGYAPAVDDAVDEPTALHGTTARLHPATRTWTNPSDSRLPSATPPPRRSRAGTRTESRARASSPATIRATPTARRPWRSSPGISMPGLPASSI
ncbi:MAG TPA: hypothetical protein VMM18_10895 [Gemmatimonadaceae bacterium]|nr:hypothetical protein [Gemmatimonadaceae bacterium]